MQSTSAPNSPAPAGRIAILTCGVLEWNLRQVMPRLPHREFSLHVLPAQLHANPRRLRLLLQEEIDRLSAEPGLAGIVLGFGVCGRGTIGLQAVRVPLVMPRVQDCIGVFLGSHQRYLAEFRRRPGTRYLTQGWYEKTVKARSGESYMTPREQSLYGPRLAEFEEKYGADNARFICEFRESWKRNYQRACYIRFPEEQATPPGQAVSEGLAQSLNWEHEVLDGDDSLLFALLNGDWSDSRILVVPPHNKTVPAPGAAVVGFAAGVTAGLEKLLAAYAGQTAAAPVVRQGIGLGIDTGGTYTDGVIYDFGVGRVLAFAKAITTHEDLVVGIRNLLSRLPSELLSRVGRVGISTTLATNAFVERKGRPVALFLMSPVEVRLEALPFRDVRRIDGAMNMDGEEMAPLDLEQVRRLACEARTAGCEAVAISGFASVINPRHEQEVARAVLAASGLHTVCGHELSTDLNFIERATTAAMNAKLVPLIEGLLDAVDSALADVGLRGVRTMVVKGDGSQMLSAVARDLPVETVLSGPAASVVGAARLFDCRDAVVVDMGGTTLDVAILRDGAPVLANRGARIGDFQTSVRAMDAHTTGLGGDSEIDLWAWPAVKIGPRRIIPICRLFEDHPAADQLLARLSPDSLGLGPNCLDFVALAPGVAPAGALLEHLASGPMLLDDLARVLNRACAAHIPWQEYETEGKIRRYGLTLTDILHVERRFLAFDRTAAERLLDLWATLLRQDRLDLIQGIYQQFRSLVCNEVLGILLPASCPWAQTEELREWLTHHLAEADGSVPLSPRLPVRFQVRVDIPMIPVGAPTPVLFPQLREVLNQEILISEYAGVANALGAIAGDVMLQETATVRITDDGALLCSWRGGTERASSLAAAVKTCEQAIVGLIRTEADANQVPYSPPTLRVRRQQAETRDGTVLLGLTLTAELRG